MTQTAEATSGPRPFAATTRAFLDAHALWIGVGAIAAAATGFLLHQLMAWPPHEDETLALFVGRDSLGGVVEHVTRERGGAPLHFLFAYGVAHLHLGLGSLRLVSAAFAVGSLPLIALLGRRLADRWTALIATALAAGSWVFLFHGVYARMYSLFLFLSLLSFVLLLRALDRGTLALVERLGDRDPARGRLASVRRARARRSGGVRARGPPRPHTAGGRSPSRPLRSPARRSGSPTSFSRAASTSAWAATARSSAARGRSSRTCGRRRATSAPGSGPSSSSSCSSPSSGS